jgi:hypothetical protein
MELIIGLWKIGVQGYMAKDENEWIEKADPADR